MKSRLTGLLAVARYLSTEQLSKLLYGGRNIDNMRRRFLRLSGEARAKQNDFRWIASDTGQYDSRRTFISLAQADGARKDILRWITHGPDGDIVSVYMTLPWNALCDEVAKLRIALLDGRLIELPNAASARGGDQNFTTVVTTDTVRQPKRFLFHPLGSAH